VSEAAPEPQKARLRLGTLLPLILFGALALLFLYRLGAGDPQKLPSALIGKPAPATNLPPLPGIVRNGQPVPGIASAAVPGKVTVLNVFASWCVPCRDEHPALIELDKMGLGHVRLAGLNYKDKPEAGAAFLNQLGNPYAEVGVDPAGRTGIDWGVYGVPETFVVTPDGTIAYKFVGPLSLEKLKTVLLPEIEKARK
jgi:cytochrome c biogenesis protein CcmG/thiol:disulfide interchange protein DsbE